MDYAEWVGREIDWDETGAEGMITLPEEDSIARILACEASIWLLRRAYDCDGSIIDNMASLRSDLVAEHDKKFPAYVITQSFY